MLMMMVKTKERNKKKQQQITTIRVFGGYRLAWACFFSCINEQNVDEEKTKKKEDKERETTTH